MKKVSMKKIAFVMTIAVAVAWNFPTALIAGASERAGAVDVLDTIETATTECAVLTTESELEENEKFSGISTSTNVSVPVETTTECVVTTSNVEFEEDTKYTDSSMEQQEQLSELKAKGKLLFGKFSRKEKEILGEIEQDSARVTMEDVSNLLASENDFQQVYNGMLAIAGCPDFIGGSGVTNVEFWLNETGAKKILLILEQKDIIYVDCSEDGTDANSELLYSGKQGPSSIVDKALLVGSYKVYNDIAGLSTTTTENTSVTTTSTTVVSVETTSTSSEETATTTQTEVTSEEPMETSASDITTTATSVTTSTTESSGLPQTGYRVSSKDAAMLGTALILIGSALVSYVSRKHE